MVFESGAHVGVRRESARKSGRGGGGGLPRPQGYGVNGAGGDLGMCRGRSFMQETVTTSRKEGDRYAESHLDQEPRPRILL